MRRLSCLAAALGVTGLQLLPSSAWAQSEDSSEGGTETRSDAHSEADVAFARQEFDRATDAFDSGDFAAAAIAFQKADMVVPSPHAKYWHALALDKADTTGRRTNEIIAAYQSFLHDRDSVKLGMVKVVEVQNRIIDLRKNLECVVLIRTSSGVVPELILDGVRVAECSRISSPPPCVEGPTTQSDAAKVPSTGTSGGATTPIVVHLSPGAHTLQLSASGYSTTETKFTVREGQRIEQFIPFEQLPAPQAKPVEKRDDSKPSPQTAPTAEPQHESPPETPPDNKASTQQYSFYLGGGANWPFARNVSLNYAEKHPAGVKDYDTSPYRLQIRGTPYGVGMGFAAVATDMFLYLGLQYRRFDTEIDDSAGLALATVKHDEVLGCLCFGGGKLDRGFQGILGTIVGGTSARISRIQSSAPSNFSIQSAHIAYLGFDAEVRYILLRHFYVGVGVQLLMTYTTIEIQDSRGAAELDYPFMGMGGLWLTGGIRL